MQKQNLLAAAILATFLVSAAGWDFYKLVLEWPIASCNIKKSGTCINELPSTFTIHTFSPQFANDTKVPPYAKDKSCTSVAPTTNAGVFQDKLESIEDKLTEMWPSLLSKTSDEEFWFTEWENHGMCSDYSNKPDAYFSAALTLASKYDPLKVMGIEASYDKPYQVKTVLANAKKNLGVYPQIACNAAKKKVLQLWEFRLCFDRATPPSVLIDCPKKLAGECKNETDTIVFPPF
ncbi:Ribonuclease T2-like protein [Corchorus olitorius]|uniref:Ribonuclease T2-like protein n=1 Tax=Corchorus olitorius TaxID=93759 RepID=A0A1R3IML4_9ROSI|nr:Ribonuclease T2-like protein [Corchorus olitorius]